MDRRLTDRLTDRPFFLPPISPYTYPLGAQADVATYKGDGFGVDIGPLTVGDFHSEIEKAKTFFWNGPMGIIEMPRYALGASRRFAAVQTAEP